MLFLAQLCRVVEVVKGFGKVFEQRFIPRITGYGTPRSKFR